MACSACFFDGPLKERKYRNHLGEPDLELVFTQARIPVKRSQEETSVAELHVHVHSQLLRSCSPYFDAALSDAYSLDKSKLDIPISVHVSSIWDYFGIVYGSAASGLSRSVDVVLGVALLEDYFSTRLCQWFLVCLVQPSLIIESKWFNDNEEVAKMKGRLLRQMVKLDGACRDKANFIFWEWIRYGSSRHQDKFLEALIGGVPKSPNLDRNLVVSKIKGKLWPALFSPMAERIADLSSDALDLIRYVIHVCKENKNKYPKKTVVLREAIESLWNSEFHDLEYHLPFLSEIIEGVDKEKGLLNRKRKREEREESRESVGESKSSKKSEPEPVEERN